MYRLISTLFILAVAMTSYAGHGDRGDSSKYQIEDLLKSYLELSTFRSQVLAQNLANINTPKYKADEVKIPEDYGVLNAENTGFRMACTSDKHMTRSRNGNKKFVSQKLQDPHEIKKNGNNVSLNQQMVKLSQNKNDYTSALKIHTTVGSLFTSVLKK